MNIFVIATKKINLDAAGNPIFDTTYFELNKNRRNFMLFGLGKSFENISFIQTFLKIIDQ